MKKLKQTEPVPMDVHLLLHETMINNMSKSLSHTKKRLFDAELTLNLRPADNDPNETQVWESKVNHLLNTHDNLPFPTLYHFKREYDESHLSVDAKKSEISTEWQQRMNANLNKQIEHLQNRVLHNAERHESLGTGSVIRTIDNYQGCNSFIRDGKRVLVRKESKGWVDNSSSLPPWFCPNYYPEAANYNPNAKKDIAYQIAFKATTRGTVSSERKRRAEIDRRRNEINDIKRELRSQSKSRGKGGGVAFYLTEFESPPGSASRGGTGKSAGDSGFYPPRSAGLSSLPLESSTASGNNNKSRAPILFDFNDEGGSQGSLFEDDANSLHSANSESSLSFFAKEIQERRQRESRSEKRHAQLIRSYTHKSLFSNASSQTKPARRKHLPPVAVNPIYDHNPFAVKILDIDMGNKSKPQKFQVKDYTRDAFALQPPQTRFIDYNYDEDAAELEAEILRSAPTAAVAAAAAGATSPTIGGVPTTGSPSPISNRRQSRLTLKYSSDIFKVPNVGYMAPYKPPPPIERKSPSQEDSQSPNAKFSDRPDNPEQTVSTLSAALIASPPFTAPAPGVDPYSSSPVISRLNTTAKNNIRFMMEAGASTQESVHSLGSDPYAGQFNETGDVSPRLSPFRSSDIYQQHKMRRAPTSISAIEKKPGFRDVYIAQVLGKPLPTSPKNGIGSPTAAAGGAPTTSTGPVQYSLELSEGVDLEDSINEWFEKNDVAIPSKKLNKRMQQRDTFLSHHRQLPSIELSLSGLLLEENPYTKTDPLIQKNIHKNTEDMKM